MEPKVFFGIRKTTRVATIAEAHEAIEGARNVVNVVLLPPNAGDSGNQESDTEEVLAESMKEIYKPAGELEIEENLASDDDVEPLLPPRSKRRRQELPKWKRTFGFAKDFQQVEPNFKKNLSDLEGYSPCQMWKNLFSEDILEHIVLQTNLYSNRDQNNPHFMVSTNEMRSFLGVLLLTGYHRLPEEHHYWSTQPDLGVSAVYNTLSRNRYHEIKRYLHFADNQRLTEGDKMSKISPLYNMLNCSLVQFGIFHELLSVDESMVPYFARHSAKMFIKWKPICFGYKIWCLCGSYGYPYHMQIYQGKQSNANDQPLGTRVINNMVSIISSNSNVLYHQLYFDNVFSSCYLMNKLAGKSMRATGTIRKNRTEGANKQLIQNKELQKQEKGTYDYCSDIKVYIAKWHDNSVVNIASMGNS